MTISFFLLDIIDMGRPSQEIKLDFKFDELKILFCNFNRQGQLILFCMSKNKCDVIKIVCVYSIQTEGKSSTQTKTKCQKIYMIQKEVKLISISKDDKIWLRLYNDIYEWDLNDLTTIISKNIYGVIIDLNYIYKCCYNC